MTSIHLDSHENMVFLVKYATIINQSGKSADVVPFLSDCSKLEAVPINDAVVVYDCSHTLETFILVVRNGSQIGTYVPKFAWFGKQLLRGSIKMTR